MREEEWFFAKRMDSLNPRLKTPDFGGLTTDHTDGHGYGRGNGVFFQKKRIDPCASVKSVVKKVPSVIRGLTTDHTDGHG
jgi:hypothetical protein